MIVRGFREYAIALALIANLLATGTAWAACDRKVGRLVSLQGVMDVQEEAKEEWKPATLEQEFCSGDKIRTHEQSRATVELNNKTYISLNQQTTVVFSSIKSQASSWLNLLKGVIYVRSRTPSSLDIRSQYINAAIKGTEFIVTADDKEGTVTVLEGKVESSNDKGSLMLTNGEEAVAKAGEAPVRKLLVAPRDAVQWALYYPPIIDMQTLQRQAAQPSVQQAARLYGQGDSLGALAALEAAGNPDPILHAGLLIGLGRVEEARPLLEGIGGSDPRRAEALALRSIIALARNDKASALNLAQQATRLSPNSPTAWTALSYARQSDFKLEEALAAANEAARLDSSNALAHARRAELLASLGRHPESREAAAIASDLNPRLARAWVVQGYAQLDDMDDADAEKSFRKAIGLDNADPLARFGLGLAKIRSGNLDEGITELEIAASLDPNDALTRSYLGKAYYEQKNSKVSQTEFDQAKRLDPKDPTPWFYDSIKKQTENRPVEALHDMQKAIELNGNRAVYRSKQMLDDDLAARGSALGRIYNQIGFQRLGQLESFNSLITNPTDFTAHRLLSDSYLNQPRQEMAKVSELLQSQLLQPLNITPLQPQQAEQNLLTVTGLGPADPSMNEFNPLFARDRVSLLASGIAGSFNTYGNETVVSGIYKPVSASLGQMHFASTGFRNNDDIDENLYTGFVQGQVNERLNVQGEYRHRDVENGFLGLRFAPNAYELALQNTYRRRETSDIYRLGAHWSPSLSSDVLASFAYQDIQEQIKSTPQQDALATFHTASAAPIRTYSGEAQYLFHHELVNAIIGGGHVESNGQQILTTDASLTLPPVVLPLPGRPLFQPPPVQIHQVHAMDLNKIRTNGYAYFGIRYPQNVTWTLGVSGDSLKANALNYDSSQINPKLGLTWQIAKGTALRLAYFRTLRTDAIAGQTLEPVQIAGFNQFYDDRVGTQAFRYGAALDHRFDSSLWGGVEISQRDLKVPSSSAIGNNVQTLTNHWREQLYRGYLYWTPSDRVSINLEYSYEDFSNNDFTADTGSPPNTRTSTLPLTLSYFDPTGWFAQARATYVNQQVSPNGIAYQSDDFTMLDMVLGYRLPKRLGIIQFDVRNLLDQSFRFQSNGLRTQSIEQAPYFPERAFYGRITLSF